MNAPRRFRKKPVTIEAMQIPTADQLGTHDPLAVWLEDNEVKYQYVMSGYTCKGLILETLEGWMEARIGDWIVKGIRGEFYPVKPDIFAATYEPDGND